MSFLDQFSKLAGNLLGNPNASPSDLTSQLQQHIGSMSDDDRQNLGTTLLQTFTEHSSYQGDGDQAAAEAGTTSDQVAQGSPSALNAIVQYAQAHPEVLQTVVTRVFARSE
jgi:hypothetical protein